MIRTLVHRRGGAAIVVAAFVLAACGEDSSPLRVVPVEPAVNRIVSGTDQVGTVGQAVPQPLAVLVTDKYGNPVPEADVAFTVTAGGGSVQPSSARTGLDGTARATWTLGTQVGSNRVTASAGPALVEFTALAEPGPPAAVQRVSGDGQTGAMGERLVAPLVAQITDAYGNGVPGITVTWQVTAGGGSVNPSVSVTDEVGKAFTSLTVGPAPGPNRVVATAAGLPGVTFEATALDPLNLSIAGAYIVQTTQTLAGDVPLVAGKDGLLRIFAIANQPNGARPDVRVVFYDGSTPIASQTLPAPAASTPTDVDEGSLGASYNLPVPGSLIEPGLAILVTVDPDDDVSEADEGDNTFPASGTPRTLDVRTMPTFAIRFVPVRMAGSTATGNVTSGNAASYLTAALKVFPLPDFDADVHAPFTSSVNTTGSGEAWNTIINEVAALRASEGSPLYYYGVLPNTGGSPYCGLGYVGFPVAIGLDQCGDWTAAHEWGHNFGRRHAPCGGAGNPDPNYPYANARLGAHGYDPATGQLKRPSAFADLMSYCSPEWISDYNYQRVLTFRQSEAAGQAAYAYAPAREPALLVWGRMDGSSAVLEPAFEIETRPALPREPGPYTLQGLDAAGAVVFELSFAGEAPAHGPADARQFAFAVPASLAQPQRLARLRLTGPGVPAAEVASTAAAAFAPPSPTLEAAGAGRARLRWNDGAFPLAVARDPRTGEILGFARGGTAVLETAAPELELIFSHGPGSTLRRVPVQR